MPLDSSNSWSHFFFFEREKTAGNGWCFFFKSKLPIRPITVKVLSIGNRLSNSSLDLCFGSCGAVLEKHKICKEALDIAQSIVTAKLKKPVQCAPRSNVRVVCRVTQPGKKETHTTADSNLKSQVPYMV